MTPPPPRDTVVHFLISWTSRLNVTLCGSSYTSHFKMERRRVRTFCVAVSAPFSSIPVSLSRTAAPPASCTTCSGRESPCRYLASTTCLRPVFNSYRGPSERRQIGAPPLCMFLCPVLCDAVERHVRMKAESRREQEMQSHITFSKELDCSLPVLLERHEHEFVSAVTVFLPHYAPEVALLVPAADARRDHKDEDPGPSVTPNELA